MRDVIVHFGDRDLIVPEAMVLSSKLLFGKFLGLVAEWGIRSKKEDQNFKYQHESKSYLEFTKFTLLTNEMGVK
jgi:uncharacterized membrane protein YsdA (DUF1294 family)